jgi:hypothetical protein
VANYDRAALGQTGNGHFSPLAAWHAASDRVLVLDVARFKYPPHWVPVDKLWQAMCALDPASSLARGYLVIGTATEPIDPQGLQALMRRLQRTGAPICPPDCANAPETKEATTCKSAILHLIPQPPSQAGSTMKSTLSQTLPLAAALVLALAGMPAQADLTSSASSSASKSVGSSSTSIEKSSDSSSGDKKVAQGQYMVIDVAAVAQNPDMMRVHLQAAGPGATEDFYLLLPRQAAERGQLAAGQHIEAQQRPYGLAFAVVNTTGNSNPFFLVLDDNIHRELDSRPVVL